MSAFLDHSPRCTVIHPVAPRPRSPRGVPRAAWGGAAATPGYPTPATPHRRLRRDLAPHASMLPLCSLRATPTTRPPVLLGSTSTQQHATPRCGKRDTDYHGDVDDATRILQLPQTQGLTPRAGLEAGQRHPASGRGPRPARDRRTSDDVPMTDGKHQHAATKDNLHGDADDGRDQDQPQAAGAHNPHARTRFDGRRVGTEVPQWMRMRGASGRVANPSTAISHSDDAAGVVLLYMDAYSRRPVTRKVALPKDNASPPNDTLRPSLPPRLLGCPMPQLPGRLRSIATARDPPTHAADLRALPILAQVSLTALRPSATSTTCTPQVGRLDSQAKPVHKTPDVGDMQTRNWALLAKV
ncbi:hypothetical protein BJ912DRAFT_1054532 [Pholiota molesta]|nr:hypothetical protein BJ912DRAFT_1054532 [Pholiota molesta]